MSTASVTFQPELNKRRSQISDLVRQYTDIAYAAKPFVPGQSAVTRSGKLTFPELGKPQ